MPTCKTQQSRRQRPSSPYAANAVPSRNLGKEVVAVAVVLGSETVDVLVMSGSITRGMKASRSAKHGRGPRKLSADSQTRLNDYTLPTVLTRETLKQSWRLEKHLHSRQPTPLYQSRPERQVLLQSTHPSTRQRAHLQIMILTKQTPK